MPPPPPPPPPPPFGGPPPPPSGYSNYPSYQAYDSPSVNYAGFGARLGGRLLDGLLYGLLGLVFAIPALVLIRQALDDCYRGVDDQLYCPDGAVKGGPLAAGIAVIVLGVIVLAVIYIRALGRTGQTWGRKIAGVKVVSKETGQPIGVGRALGRTLFEGVVSGNLCFLGYLWMLWDKDKQTWHDKIVGSVVVRV